MLSALIGSYSPTFWDSLLVTFQGSSSPRCSTLEHGTDRLSRNDGQ